MPIKRSKPEKGLQELMQITPKKSLIRSLAEFLS